MKDKRIPTIIGTILLLTILFFGVWLSLQTTNTQSKASGDCNPSGVQVTNLTNKSADISFITPSSCSTFVVVNTKTIKNFQDKSVTHYFRIDGLSASSKYDFYILSEGNEHRQTSYTFTTAPLPGGNLSTANLAWGKVVLANGSPSQNNIVYLNISGAWLLSALTDNNGQWHVLLSNSFTDDKSSLFIPPITGNEDIYVYSSDNQLTQVENSVTNNDPVPNIIIGQGLDNNQELNVGIGATTTPTSIPTKTSTPTPITINSKLVISYPTEGESITALKPDIFGTGKNNSTVNLSIDTDIIGKTTSRADGSWNWSPTANLTMGKHLLTVTLGNELLQRNFIISKVASNTSPLSFSSTPSATLAPVATVVPTAIPTIRAAKISTSTKIPVTGNTNPFIYLILSSLLAVTFSLYFFYQDEK